MIYKVEEVHIIKKSDVIWEKLSHVFMARYPRKAMTL
jgi:hypothetical protein